MDQHKINKKAAHERYVADLRDGRRQRAQVFDKASKAARDKRACRGRVEW